MMSSIKKHLPIAIIAAMAQEAALLRGALVQKKVTTIAGMDIVQGFLEDKPVVLMQCGIGKVNAALGTTLLLDHFQAQSVINTGSAGALDSRLNVGDVVIADALLHHDVDVTAFGYVPGQMAQMPATYAGDQHLLDAVRQVATSTMSCGVHSGMIVSGDQFIHGGAALAKIKQHFPQALAVEMEAAAIAQVCYRFAVPFTVIRAISDNANGDACVDFDAFLEQASTHSANMVRQLLRII